MKRVFAALGAAVVLAITATQVPAVLSFRLIELDGNVVKWGEPELGSPANVRVGFVERPMQTADARNCGRMAPISEVMTGSGLAPAELRAEVRAALDAWERVAGIRFELVERASEADILIGAQGDPSGHAFANVAHESGEDGGVASLARSLVCLNPHSAWKVGFDGNLDVYDLRYTIAHEIGHAIGLNHPGPSGQLMSFRYEELFRDLQHGDIEGALLLYGPPAHRNH